MASPHVDVSALSTSRLVTGVVTIAGRQVLARRPVVVGQPPTATPRVNPPPDRAIERRRLLIPACDRAGAVRSSRGHCFAVADTQPRRHQVHLGHNPSGDVQRD